MPTSLFQSCLSALKRRNIRAELIRNFVGTKYAQRKDSNVSPRHRISSHACKEWTYYEGGYPNTDSTMSKEEVSPILGFMIKAKVQDYHLLRLASPSSRIDRAFSFEYPKADSLPALLLQGWEGNMFSRHA